MRNFISRCTNLVSAPFKSASKQDAVPHKHVPITKLASRRADSKAKEWFWGIIIAASCGLGSWALKCTVDLYADMKEEKALRASTDEKLEKFIDSYKSDTEKSMMDIKADSEKRLAEYKLEIDRRIHELRIESDRRFSEIQKQLELLNNKLDQLLTRPKP